MKKKFFILAFAGLLLSGFSYFVISGLPTEKSTLFSGSGNCTQCHSASAGVLINAAGRDVSPVFHWQSSMMGNAVKDPYWQAKVSSEVEENPHLKEIIEDKCLTCHAPMGRTEAIYNGQASFSFQEMKEDPLSQDGVSCTVCHQIDPANLSTAESFSGHYAIQAVKLIYGPYENPFATSMVNNTGYTPVYGSHIASSGLCATCHTLITPYVDQNGDIAGYFPEQMPYYEWLNSSYPGQDITCQKCHMPNVNEEFTIASMPANLQNKRNPVFEHHFVGGNRVVNKMLNDNAAELTVNSGKANLDTTALYTLKNLKQNTIEFASQASFQNNMVTVNLEIKNKTGHKLPTGFPSRRMWIHFVAKDNNGNIVFESGKYDDNGEILTEADFEHHHDTIFSSEEVQIYEAVMGNTQNQVTTILLEAAQYLKDNRLPPVGFKTGLSYDSLIAITGDAINDLNFNRNSDGEHGTGTDRLTYYFPFTGTSLQYTAEVCYQSIKPGFANHIALSATEESKRFTQMYQLENLPKVEIISQLVAQLFPSKINNLDQADWEIYPNPAKDKVFLSGNFDWPLSYSIYSFNGKLILKGTTDDRSVPLRKVAKGTYILKVKSGQMEKSFKLICN
ncbi:MAG: T9SS type A sorting domain-containing protein [Prolixibacteraceae bacterium]